jgi:signal transduction histidine kinase
MSAFSSPNPERSHGGHRTIRATFVATVVVPVASMLVIWGLLVAGVLSGALGGTGTSGRPGIFLVAGVGLVIILISVALMGLFTRRIAADIGDLEATAEHLANEEMPKLVEKLRRGEAVTADEAQPATRAVTAEIARAEAALASLARSAAAAAAAEASLRNGIGQVFVSLARRNQSLLQRQLRLIDALEQKASDPATLADLFPLDHLTTRMRRHAEGLIILSGAAPGRSWSEPVPVIDVVRGAVAEIEDYKRVSVLTRSEDAVAGQAVADMIHLLAELIENATLSSPSGTRVEVRAERVANGFAIEVDDRGLGIEAGQLATINAQLANPPDFDLANADQLGLFVVGKLAARHGVRVALRPSPYGGTTAVVLMPNNIVVPLNVTDAIITPDARQALGRGRELDPPTPDALALPGRHSAPPLPVGGASPAPADQPGLESGTTPFDAGFSLGPPAPIAGSPGPGSLSTRSTDSFRPAPRPASGGPGTGAPAAASPATTGPAPSPATGPAPSPATGPALPAAASAAAASPAAPATTGPTAPATTSPTAPATTGPAVPAAAPLPRRRGDAEAAGAEGPQPDGAQPDGAPPGTSTYRGLPRRVRQASLNPHLRQPPAGPDRAAPAGQPAPADSRTPEEARNLVSSLQRGWQRGRASEPAAAQASESTANATTDERDARLDADAPQAGEA